MVASRCRGSSSSLRAAQHILPPATSSGLEAQSDAYDAGHEAGDRFEYRPGITETPSAAAASA
jgi:hypothetical protein